MLILANNLFVKQFSNAQLSLTQIFLYFTKFSKSLPSDLWDNYFDLLPCGQKEINSYYRRWQERHSHLFGKILLLQGLKHFGFDKNILLDLKYNRYSRPYLNSNIDFSISHSGMYVICVIGKGVRVGVDIEEIRKIDFNDFQKVMSSDQWEDILHSNNPLQSFYSYWTIKESVIKADSRGLSIPLMGIHVKNNCVNLNNQIWYITDLKIDENYRACIASSISDITLVIKEIDFYNFCQLKDEVFSEKFK